MTNRDTYLCTSRRPEKDIRPTLLVSFNRSLRSDNGDANENVAEKQTSRPLKLFRPSFKSSSYLKEGKRKEEPKSELALLPSNFIALIAALLICQMLAFFSRS